MPLAGRSQLNCAEGELRETAAIGGGDMRKNNFVPRIQPPLSEAIAASTAAFNTGISS
jgi:hypothetical protein